ncbi:hypothetical protein NDK25_08200 [Niallia taxi]|nr:hypothetical protein [Niallia taxi]
MTLNKRTFPLELSNVTSDMSFASTWNSGALSPTFTSLPSKVTVLFLNVIAGITLNPSRFINMYIVYHIGYMVLFAKKMSVKKTIV